MLRRLEERVTEVGVVAEAVAEDAESTWGVTEALCNVAGRQVTDEISTEGLVLTVADSFWAEEEVGCLGRRYGIFGAGSHEGILLLNLEQLSSSCPRKLARLAYLLDNRAIIAIMCVPQRMSFKSDYGDN